MMVCYCRLLVFLRLLHGSCSLTVPLLLTTRVNRKTPPTAITASRIATSPEQRADTRAASSDHGSFYIPSQKPRPLHQNWWPVSALYALHESRPNPIQVLDKKLVAVYDQNLSGWNVLDDRCSHRFAPLSEGRVVTTKSGTTCLQCAYHGWEFETATGKCTLVPQQQDKVDKARAVQTYPTRIDAGMLWVWTDTETRHSLAPTIPLPIDPLLRSHVANFGNSSCYMRDLPYGMEILGENLLDLSHLPFAHHSVGMLNRNIGGSLPTRMLSEAERKQNVLWEKKYHNNNNNKTMVLATFQAEIVNASIHDPLFKAFANAGIAGAGAPPKDWTTTIAYYDPCHVRYRRWRGTASHVELFLCPTSQGRSRVFLFNAMERQEQGIRVQQKTPRRLAQILTALNPSTWKTSLMRLVFQRMLSGHRGHLISHLIFDGDGIFLHRQGNRMKRANLTYSDYSTPSSADILLNAYRRFLDTAATITRNSGSSGNQNKQHPDDLAMMASAVVGMDNYGDDAPRSEMLDRYNTHTKDCPVCSNALQRARRFKRRLGLFQTSLHGSAGAMTTASLVLLLAKVTIRSCADPFVSGAFHRMVVATAAMAWFGSWAALRAENKLDKKINSFIFEDYVHAEKN